MDCLHPLKIINPTKFLSKEHRDRYCLYVRCGKCAACQEYNKNVWYLRTFYEFQECVSKGGYVLFDCLTYAPKYVPKVSQFFDIPKRLDCYCFNYEHLRQFMKLLRRNLRNYDVEDNLRFFASTEYGTKLNGTHRPHIHLLLFCSCPDLDPLTLSKAVSKSWKYGRTDGLPYKSRKYVQHNSIGNDLQTSLRVCNYVAKYVMKDSSFQKRIDERIDRILWYEYKKQIKTLRDYVSFEDWLRLPDGKLFCRNVRNRLNQFHRQSLHYGECALRDLDMNTIMLDNLMTIPDANKIKMRLGLPAYYKRKLFYEQIEIDGQRFWQPTELGLQYLELRQNDLINRLTSEYEMWKRHGISIPDVSDLVEYVVHYRGRLKADKPEIRQLLSKLEVQELIYNYVTNRDMKQFSQTFVTSEYLGMKDTYFGDVAKKMSIQEFCDKYVYFNPEFEQILTQIDRAKNINSQAKQQLYENRQRLMQKYKNIYPK